MLTAREAAAAREAVAAREAYDTHHVARRCGEALVFVPSCLLGNHFLNRTLCRFAVWAT